MLTDSPCLFAPLIQQADVLSTAPVEVGVRCAGEDACRTADDLKVDLDMTFSVKVNRTEEDVLLVAQNLGCEKASDPEFVQDLFGRKFGEALRTVVRQFDHEALDRDLPKLREEVLLMIGRDLNGFVIEDLVIESCKATPLEFYDENDPFDQRGLARIKEQVDASESQPDAQGEPAW